MKTKLTTLFLLFSGSIGIIIGTSLLFNPIDFEASADIPIANNINLLSEIRSSGGTLLAAGIVMLWGAFSLKVTQTALIISSLFYLAYGIARSISMVIDGIPSSSLVSVTIAELIIGTLSVLLLQNFRAKNLTSNVMIK